MILASQKRKENVAEYIIFMWQLTDLLRALELNPQNIQRSLVDPLNLPEPQATEELRWYLDLVEILRQEGKERKGFPAITEYLVGELNEFHLRLLQEPKDDAYKIIVFSATPALTSYKQRCTEPQPSDIAYAFHALYSKMLAHMQRTELTEQTEEAFRDITRMVSYLTSMFGKFERGQFAFTEE